jgi:hypothetical protein
VPETTSLIGGIRNSQGRQVKRKTLVDNTIWYQLPPVLGETEAWVLLNETASQLLYVAIDPIDDPNIIGATFTDYFTLSGLGTARDSWAEQSKPESIYVKGAAANQVVVLMQLARDMQQFRSGSNKPGQEGRVI